MAESTDGDSLLSPNSSTYVTSCDDEQGIDTDALDDVPIHKDHSPLLEDQFKDDDEDQKPSATGEGRGTFHTEGRSFSSDHFPTQSKSVEKTIRQRAMFRVFIEVLKDQFVWWEFATAHRDIAFEVAFHYPIPRTVYNTEDALFEGMLTHVRHFSSYIGTHASVHHSHVNTDTDMYQHIQVEMFQDRCTEKGITVTKTGLLRYMNAMFGEEEVAEKLDEIFKYVQELQDGDPIVDTSRSRKTRGIDRCDDEAREIVDKLSKKVCLVPMARHASHHMVQYGFIQAPDEGQICLTWDNSYSRVRSKVLSLHYEVAEGDCPPASWRAGPQTVQSGPSSRENLIGTTKTKKHKNRFMERLSLMKSLLEQVRSGSHVRLFLCY